MINLPQNMHRISAAARLRYGLAEFGPMPLIAALILIAQALLGLGVRYGYVGVIAHMAGAAVSVVVVLWAGIQSILRHWDFPGIRRAAMLMVSCTFSQLLLGIGSYWSQLNGGLEWFPALHAVAGLGAVIAAGILANRIYQRVHPEDEAMARGGIAIA